MIILDGQGKCEVKQCHTNIVKERSEYIMVSVVTESFSEGCVWNWQSATGWQYCLFFSLITLIS